jgi:hypothetical protein
VAKKIRSASTETVQKGFGNRTQSDFEGSYLVQHLYPIRHFLLL